jgi:hypothetical protein
MDVTNRIICTLKWFMLSGFYGRYGWQITEWVVTFCRIMSLFRQFEGALCFHLQGDGNRFRWLLKLFGGRNVSHRKVARTSVRVLFPVPLLLLWYGAALLCDRHISSPLSLQQPPESDCHPEDISITFLRNVGEKLVTLYTSGSQSVLRGSLPRPVSRGSVYTYYSI